MNLHHTAPRLAAQIGRYAHAKQFKRMRKAVRTLTAFALPTDLAQITCS